MMNLGIPDDPTGCHTFLQVAYPIWDTSLLTELDTELMERLFTDANLLDVWEARRCQGGGWEM